MIDIYRLHTLIEEKARKNKREYPFHPDWRIPHNGKQKPADPEWALRTVERGISDGFLNIQQAEKLRAAYKPQAEAYAKNTMPPQVAEYKPAAATANNEPENGQQKQPTPSDTVEKTPPLLKVKPPKGTATRPSPTGTFIDIGVDGYRTYKQGERLLQKDMEDMEKEEREIYKEYPRRTRNFLSRNIQQEQDFKDFDNEAKRNGVVIPKDKYLWLQQIERARRKQQINQR